MYNNYCLNKIAMVTGGGSRMGQLKTVAMRNNELQTRVSNVF
jgi:hypothetical protein